MGNPARVLPAAGGSESEVDGSFKSTSSSLKSRASYEAHLEWQRGETKRQQTRVTKAGFKMMILGTILYMHCRILGKDWHIYGTVIGLLGLLLASTSDLDLDDFMRDNTLWCGVILVTWAQVPVSVAVYENYFVFFVAAAPYLYGVCRCRAVTSQRKGAPRWTCCTIVSIVLFLLVAGAQNLYKAVVKQWPHVAADGVTALEDRDGEAWDTGYLLFALHTVGAGLVAYAYSVDQRHGRPRTLSMWTAQCQGLVVIGVQTIVWSFGKEPNNAATSGATFAAGVVNTVVPTFVLWYRESLFGVWLSCVLMCTPRRSPFTRDFSGRGARLHEQFSVAQALASDQNTPEERTGAMLRVSNDSVSMKLARAAALATLRSDSSRSIASLARSGSSRSTDSSDSEKSFSELPRVAIDSASAIVYVNDECTISRVVPVNPVMHNAATATQGYSES